MPITGTYEAFVHSEALRHKEGLRHAVRVATVRTADPCRRPARTRGEEREGARGLWRGDVTARGGLAVSVRPAVELSGRVHDARAVNKTIAMLFESPNAKLFPAFNIPPPVRLR
ncbi:jg22173 [Pararge aegeria aegeria]|uniref:Jg22173 protein n=1 Tax=Pararge aegeria aegeria TaxID=348720 RepID=A0A8S4R0I4_9NEOP|nr:jg22173 [Pararge aegeria aegeria]